jgi:c-di-GMP-binding flagellar brake protein YcgR
LNESDQWIREGMTLKGHLFLLDRQPIEVSCTVRYKRTDVITKKQPIFGLQFTGMSQIIKNKIIALVLDLYRQQFAGRNS